MRNFPSLQWRKILNPIDWLAWVYGKCFINHPWWGLVTVICFTSIIASLMWYRAIEKYDSEHQIKVNDTALPLQQSVQEISTAKHPPDLSKVKPTLINSINKFNPVFGSKLKDASGIVPGYFELSADPNPDGPDSRFNVTTKEQFSTHFYASVRLAAIENVNTMDVMGGDFWVGVDPGGTLISDTRQNRYK